MTDREPTVTAEELRAVGFAECCRRLGISTRTGKRLITAWKFPIPELPLLGRHRRYSTYEIDLYLREASVRDALTASARRRLGIVSR